MPAEEAKNVLSGRQKVLTDIKCNTEIVCAVMLSFFRNIWKSLFIINVNEKAEAKRKVTSSAERDGYNVAEHRLIKTP